MTPQELTQAQKALGMKNTTLCRTLGVTEASLCNWKAGRTPIPGPVSLAVSLLLSTKTK